MQTSIAHPHHAAGRAERSKRWLRGRVWLRRFALDRQLAQGADPTSSPELRHRAAQLTSPRCRRSLAGGITRTIEAAEEPVRTLTSAVPLQRREVLAARDELTDLARELAEGDSVQVHGIALVKLLLSDGSSPLYVPHPEESLDTAVRQARAALLLR